MIYWKSHLNILNLNIIKRKLSKELGLGVGISSGANFLGVVLSNKNGLVTFFVDDLKNKYGDSTLIVNSELIKEFRRTVQEIYNTEIKTDYNHADEFNRYPKDIMAEFNQSIEEGLDLEKYKSLFETISTIPARSLFFFIFDKIWIINLN